jgi:hypothetical protein
MLEIDKENEWGKTLERFNNGEINIQEFVDTMKDHKLYYSTPLGEDKEGNTRLYILLNNETGHKYLPAFLSQESCSQFYNELGRNGFLIIKGNLGNFLSVLDSSNELAEYGVVIEPSSPNTMGIPPGIRGRQ